MSENKELPTMPIQDNNDDGAELPSSESSNLSPDGEVSQGTSPDEEEDGLILKKPEIVTAETKISNRLKIADFPKGGVKVIATRKGFIFQQRVAKGATFTIRSEKEFGEWMKCLDADQEKMRVEFFKNKKSKNSLMALTKELSLEEQEELRKMLLENKKARK